MANFQTPFADDGDRRIPGVDEQADGFPCGPADRLLFNFLFWAVQSEIGEVIDYAGLTGTNSDMTQLRQAIQAMIDAATGGGDTSNFLLVAQARARLPIYPEVLNVAAHFGIVSPGAGQIRIPAGVNFQHRGIYPITTVQTDFATDPSKTYHLRWNPTDGFTVKDLASGVYNPGPVAETDVKFDSTYDDMLIARIITNSSNVPAITNLMNLNRLRKTIVKASWTEDPSTYPAPAQVAVNFARTPVCHITAGTAELTNFEERISSWGNAEVDNRYTAKPFVFGSRYTSSNQAIPTDGRYMNCPHTAVFTA